MSGPGPGKIKIGKADVYIHLKGKSGASVTHVDLELKALNKIIKPGESTYVGAKEGGVFLGLKKNMISRAEKLAKR
jgi:fatty acid/phospholipid biosynthesis enzyme